MNSFYWRETLHQLSRKDAKKFLVNSESTLAENDFYTSNSEMK